MSWGGRRAGAGRKSNAETERCRAILDRALSEADWEAIFKNQLRIASTGDGPAAVAAAKFLAHHRWGDPVEPEPEADEIEPIRTIEVHLPPASCEECAVRRKKAAAGEPMTREIEGWRHGVSAPAPAPGKLERNLINQDPPLRRRRH